MSKTASIHQLLEVGLLTSSHPHSLCSLFASVYLPLLMWVLLLYEPPDAGVPPFLPPYASLFRLPNVNPLFAQG